MMKLFWGLLVIMSTLAFGMTIADVNKASKEELMLINGIGESKADAIIAERKKAKFTSFEDLQRVKGVGPQLAEHIKTDKKHADKQPKKKTEKK
jgi:competence protein ComEA